MGPWAQLLQDTLFFVALFAHLFVWSQAWWLAMLISALWIQRQADPLDLLSCLLGKLQTNQRFFLKNKLDSIWGVWAEVDLWPVHEWIGTHIWIYTKEMYSENILFKIPNPPALMILQKSLPLHSCHYKAFLNWIQQHWGCSLPLNCLLHARDRHPRYHSQSHCEALRVIPGDCQDSFRWRSGDVGIAHWWLRVWLSCWGWFVGVGH